MSPALPVRASLSPDRLPGPPGDSDPPTPGRTEDRLKPNPTLPGPQMLGGLA